MDGDEHGHTATLGVLVPDHVPRRLGRHHEAVHALGRGYLTVMDVETMGEHQVVALLHVLCDLASIHARLELVRYEHHDHVGPLRGL